jgi:hypothetical protein
MGRRSDRIRKLDRQPDLFDPPLQPLAHGVMPNWATLPQQTRRMLTTLVTRLLVDHASGRGRGRGRGRARDARSDADEC